MCYNPDMNITDNLDITSNKQYQFIYEDNQVLLEYIAKNNDLKKTFDKIVHLAEHRNSNSKCSILILNDSKKNLLSGSAPSLPDFYNEAINGVEIGEKVGSCGSAAFKQERVIVEDIDTHENWQPYLALTQKANLHACWSEPIFSSSGEIFGSFAIYNDHIKSPTDFELKLISSYAHLASVAIEKENYNKLIKENEHQLERLIEERTKELLASKQETDEAMERFNAVMLATEDGIWDWNVVTNEVYYSPAWQTMLGYEVGEITQDVETWKQLLHPDDLVRVMELATKFITNESNEYRLEFRLLCKDGSYKWVLARAKDAERDEKGHVTRIIGTHVDIQEKKELEEKLSLINENLEKRIEVEVLNNIKKDKQMLHQSRLAQMGEMLAMIAHQWRQPLGSIAASTLALRVQVDLEKLKLEDEDKKYIMDHINNVNLFTQNLSTTIDDFRNFYKPTKKSDTIKLEEICKKSLSIIKTSLINNNINVIEDYCCDDKLEMYINEMIQVVLNILKNAEDNILEKDIREPYIKISTNDKVLSICDNGGGISNDIIDKLFDPYFSTKGELNGTGLGLYMSKIIVEEHHNAKLEVENTDDGVCFKIEFV